MLELRRHRPHGGGVGAVQGEHRGEHHDHPRPGGAAHALDHLAAQQPSDPAREAHELVADAGRLGGALGRVPPDL